MASPSSLPTSHTLTIIFLLLSSLPLIHTSSTKCISYCGNITIDYPFATRDGCGHSAFRQLLFCINELLLLHISSGSYRVLSIDYAFRRLTLHDPTMSDCYSLAPSTPSRGFIPDFSRAQFLHPAPDNVFLLLGCRHDSPLFQLGLSSSNDGISCDSYYRCPAWDLGGRPWAAGSAYPECCRVPAGFMKEVNLTRLRCAAYSSAYIVAPVRPQGAGDWSYGIRVAYNVPGDDDAGCRVCRVSGGACGYDVSGDGREDDYGVVLPRMCLCGGGGGGDGAWNASSSCDSTGRSSAGSVIKQASILKSVVGGWLAYIIYYYIGAGVFAI